MELIYLLLFVAALVIFSLAAFGFAARRVNLMALGLACLTLVLVLQAFPKV